MTVRRGGLGRGLGALIPTAPRLEGDDADEAPSGQDAPVAAVEDIGARFAEIDVAAIQPNPQQPREDFDPDAMSELVTSIREVGVLQPVVVRPVGDGRFQLIMGERRWRASRAAGLAAVPAIVRETADDHLLRDALLENLHRQQLNPLEEAAAYQQLLAEFGSTHDELADRIGRSRSQISNTIRLLNLPPAVQRRVAAGVLSAGHARALLSLPDAAAQESLAGRVVAEGLSVRATEEIVAAGPAPDADPTSGAAGARRRAEPGEVATAAARELEDRLDTSVTVTPGRRRGKIVIGYAGDDDLRRIVAVIAGSGGEPIRAGAVSTPAPDKSISEATVAPEPPNAAPGWPTAS